MRWSSVLKFFLGVLLAIAILAAGGLVAARVMMARLAVMPPKPMFPNDTPTKLAPKPVAKPAAEKPTVEKQETAAKPLPAGAYPARVSQSIGLILRDAPSQDSNSVGGVDFNEKITVIDTSVDGTWQKIRLSNNQEGWVRAGNVEKISQ